MAVEYLATLASASETTKYAVASTAGDSLRSGTALTTVGTAERSARAVMAGPRPASVRIARVDAAGELAQLLDRELELSGRLVGGSDRVRVPATGVIEALPKQPQGQRQGHQPLLRAIVQVALEPSSLLVGGFDDACARAADLGFGCALIGEIADDRGHFIGPLGAMRASKSRVPAGGVEREVVGLQLARLERAAGRRERRSRALRRTSARTVGDQPGRPLPVASPASRRGIVGRRIDIPSIAA